jgi:hypothetical protein
MSTKEASLAPGCPIASMGNTWMMLTYGFGGMRDYNGTLSFWPRRAPQVRRDCPRHLHLGPALGAQRALRASSKTAMPFIAAVRWRCPWSRTERVWHTIHRTLVAHYVNSTPISRDLACSISFSRRSGPCALERVCDGRHRDRCADVEYLYVWHLALQQRLPAAISCSLACIEVAPDGHSDRDDDMADHTVTVRRAWGC